LCQFIFISCVCLYWEIHCYLEVILAVIREGDTKFLKSWKKHVLVSFFHCNLFVKNCTIACKKLFDWELFFREVIIKIQVLFRCNQCCQIAALYCSGIWTNGYCSGICFLYKVLSNSSYHNLWLTTLYTILFGNNFCHCCFSFSVRSALHPSFWKWFIEINACMSGRQLIDG
jgi:hypothetical protein